MTDADGAQPDASDRMSGLFASHRDSLTRYVVRRVGVDAASDVVSETFLIAWRRLDSIPDGFEKAWLFKTAQFVIGHHERTSRRQDRLAARVVISADDGFRGQSADHAGAVADALLIQSVLGSLSRRDQEALRLVEWDQLSVAEAALVAGCSQTAFKSGCSGRGVASARLSSRRTR